MYSNCDCVTVQADYVITDIKFQTTNVGGNLLGVKQPWIQSSPRTIETFSIYNDTNIF